jgi:hypothetical protein
MQDCDLHTEPISGHDIASKKVFRIEPDDLVFSNVFAWEGAVAIASDSENGMIGSHRFMTYRVNEKVADFRYLLRYFYGGCPAGPFGPQADPAPARTPAVARRLRRPLRHRSRPTPSGLTPHPSRPTGPDTCGNVECWAD